MKTVFTFSLFMFASLVFAGKLQASTVSIVNFSPDSKEFIWSRANLLRGDTAALSEFQKEQIIALNMMRTRPQYYARQIVSPLIQALKRLPQSENSVEWEVSFEWQSAGGSPMVRKEKWEIILDKAQTFRAATSSLLSTLESMQAIQPLRAQSAVTRAAEKHAKWMEKTNTFSHTGEGKSNLPARLKREGIVYDYAGENIQYSDYPAYMVVLDLLIDEGIPGYGHRVNILDGRFNAVGIGRSGSYHCQNFAQLP